VEAFRVKIGETTHDIRREKLLDFFWTDRADTHCMVCQSGFSDARGPPIRTFSLNGPELPKEQDSLLELSKLVIQVHIRHLGCLTGLGIQYFHISHVWHQEVADAHLSKDASAEAAALAWFVPIRILNSATRTLKDTVDRVEIWHDYLSVPQWNYAVQQSLLVYLPAIFKAGLICLIHLDDISKSILIAAFDKKSTAREVAESTSHFFESHWFRRLRVALEYISCTQACFMIEEAIIVRMENQTPLDSFTISVQLSRQMIREILIWEGVDLQIEFYKKYSSRRVF
jgi:hypothetical protein